MTKRRSAPPAPRDAHGRFLKNVSGNPGGRPKGTSNKAPDKSHTIAIKQAGKTRRVDPEPIIMRRLAAAALSGGELDQDAAKLYMRERRLERRQQIQATKARQPRARAEGQYLYHEEALIALGVLKVNRRGQLVIARMVFADLDRMHSKGEFSPKEWRAVQLAVESPQVLRNRYPRRRLTYTTESQANRARADAIEAATADYEGMAAELEEQRQHGGQPGKKRRS